MKHKIGSDQPPWLVEDWPSKYYVFSWLECVVTVPNSPDRRAYAWSGIALRLNERFWNSMPIASKG